MRTRRPLHVIALGAALLAASSASREARAGDAEKGAAQALFEQGRALVEERRFPEACPKFAESLRLDAGIGTMLWLADCYENSGKTASAWAQFKEAAATATLKHDSRADLARHRAAELEPKLARLVLVPPADRSVEGLDVRRDGVTIGAPELGVPIPVNPGVHEIRVEAPGRKAWSTTVTVVDRPSTTSVPITVLEAEPEAAGSLPGPTTTTAVDGTSTARSAARGRTALSVASGVSGIVAFAVGSAFGVDAKSTYDQWRSTSACSSATPSSTCVDQRNSASDEAVVADVLFGVGAAALVAGAVLYFTAPKASPGALRLTTMVSSKGGGLALTQAW